MIPYITVLIIIYTWIVLENKTIGRKTIIVPLLLLGTLAAVRYYGVGTDADMYTRYFRFPFNTYAFYFDPDVEAGYQYFVYLIRELYSDDYFLYFAIMAIVCIIPVLYTLKKFSIDYPLSVYIYITFGLYFALYNQVRQAIAMGICFYATKYLLKKEFLKYSLFILIASQFHITALVMIGMYFVCHNKIRLEIKALSISVVGAIAAPLLIAHMALNNSRYEHYTEAATNNGTNGLLTVGLYTAMALFFYIFGRRIRNEDNDYKIFECMYICGVAALLPVAMLGTDPAGPQRIVQYFLYYIMLLFPVIFKKINNTLITFLFMIMAFVYFTLMISNNIACVFPYKLNSIFELI
ncbi:EpsG family protein [Klebsiella pneumoniae]|uniref:EpsG family protein n=1 Tax=Klebsiella pneumoniae TaxID=573 RepID=UPI0039735877|nr:EpsG family protein [Klebsiella pneumoniae]